MWVKTAPENLKKLLGLATGQPPTTLQPPSPEPTS